MTDIPARLGFTRDDLAPAIFGSWDGAISILGVMVADHGLTTHQLLTGGLGGAIAATFSMGTGQYQELTPTERRDRGVRLGTIMAVFTLLGGLLYVLPFYGGKTFGYILGSVLLVGLATAVWILQREGLVGAVRTYLLLGVTAAATILVPLVVT